MPRPQEDQDEDLSRLIELLAQELGRLPTEDEVYGFIFGTSTVRKEILEG